MCSRIVDPELRVQGAWVRLPLPPLAEFGSLLFQSGMQPFQMLVEDWRDKATETDLTRAKDAWDM